MRCLRDAGLLVFLNKSPSWSQYSGTYERRYGIIRFDRADPTACVINVINFDSDLIRFLYLTHPVFCERK